MLGETELVGQTSECGCAAANPINTEVLANGTEGDDTGDPLRSSHALEEEVDAGNCRLVDDSLGQSRQREFLTTEKSSQVPLQCFSPVLLASSTAIVLSATILAVYLYA